MSLLPGKNCIQINELIFNVSPMRHLQEAESAKGAAQSTLPKFIQTDTASLKMPHHGMGETLGTSNSQIQMQFCPENKYIRIMDSCYK